MVRTTKQRREGDYIRLNRWLAPLAWLYGLVVLVRNFLYDVDALKGYEAAVPVISVGNITVGGAGKTPHTEYLARLLQDRFRIAILSRGYKRKTRGFRLADDKTTLGDIGDEPYQMHRKYPKVNVAVDANRKRGIERLTGGGEAANVVEVVLLDDAYQHRRVKPSLNILLIDYHRMIFRDALLPVGRLREPCVGKKRADAVIVTKCPRDLAPMEYRVLQKQLALYPYQELFFTTMKYGALVPVFGDALVDTVLSNQKKVLLITGVASPEHLVRDMTPRCKELRLMRFADHHRFTKADAEAINTMCRMCSPDILLTTEKDAVRLGAVSGTLLPETRRLMYYVPIEVEFLDGQAEVFNKYIIDHIQNRSRQNACRQIPTLFTD